jgi:hypothetical protein
MSAHKSVDALGLGEAERSRLARGRGDLDHVESVSWRRIGGLPASGR